jgi:hypothetical protein
VTNVSEALTASIIRATIEAVSTSETLLNFYQTTQRKILEDSHLRTRRPENLKSHLLTEMVTGGGNEFFAVL